MSLSEQNQKLTSAEIAIVIYTSRRYDSKHRCGWRRVKNKLNSGSGNGIDNVTVRGIKTSMKVLQMQLASRGTCLTLNQVLCEGAAAGGAAGGDAASGGVASGGDANRC